MELAPQLPPARRVDLPGRGQTWVYDTGPRDAPTLLLMHGWTSSAALNWYRCFPPLTRRYRVVAFDHRGHGRGVRSRRPFTLEDCADDAAALVGELGLGPVTAIGYSMGGPVALLMWRRHPDLVSGLVLCATAGTFGVIPRWSGRRGDAMFAVSVGLGFLPARLRRRGMGYVASRWAESGTAHWAAEEWARHDPAALMQCGIALSRYDVTSWLGDIDVPAAVVVTEQDTTVRPWRQEALVQAIPGARAFPVAGAHRACAEQHREFVPALLAAVESVTGPSLNGPSGSAGVAERGL